MLWLRCGWHCAYSMSTMWMLQQWQRLCLIVCCSSLSVGPAVTLWTGQNGYGCRMSCRSPHLGFYGRTTHNTFTACVTYQSLSPNTAINKDITFPGLFSNHSKNRCFRVNITFMASEVLTKVFKCQYRIKTVWTSISKKEDSLNLV